VKTGAGGGGEGWLERGEKKKRDRNDATSEVSRACCKMTRRTTTFLKGLKALNWEG